MKTYYKITEKISKNPKKNILYAIFPSQNPDLEKNFENISYWFIEFENEIPTREIALNSKNISITKIPDGKIGF